MTRKPVKKRIAKPRLHRRLVTVRDRNAYADGMWATISIVRGFDTIPKVVKPALMQTIANRAMRARIARDAMLAMPPDMTSEMFAGIEIAGVENDAFSDGVLHGLDMARNGKKVADAIYAKAQALSGKPQTFVVHPPEASVEGATIVITGKGAESQEAWLARMTEETERNQKAMEDLNLGIIGRAFRRVFPKWPKLW